MIKNQPLQIPLTVPNKGVYSRKNQLQEIIILRNDRRETVLLCFGYIGISYQLPVTYLSVKGAQVDKR